MIVRAENIIKKVDSLGRVTLPKGIRDRLGFEEGQELEIFTMEYEEREYIGLSIPKDDSARKWRQAAQTLQELGLEVPKELQEKIG